MTNRGTHVLVLPGGGYSTHTTHEAEPIMEWLEELGVRASVFRYPLHARHPAPLVALQREIRRRRDGGIDRVGIVGFSAGGHLAGLAALAPGSDDKSESVDFVVLGYPITSMETDTYRPSQIILLGEQPTQQLRRETSCTFSHTDRIASDSLVVRVTQRLGRRWPLPGSESRLPRMR